MLLALLFLKADYLQVHLILLTVAHFPNSTTLSP